MICHVNSSFLLLKSTLCILCRVVRRAKISALSLSHVLLWAIQKQSYVSSRWTKKLLQKSLIWRQTWTTEYNQNITQWLKSVVHHIHRGDIDHSNPKPNVFNELGKRYLRLLIKLKQSHYIMDYLTLPHLGEMLEHKSEQNPFEMGHNIPSLCSALGVFSISLEKQACCSCRLSYTL